MIGCSAACGEVAFPQRTSWQGASQVSGSVDSVGSSRRSFVRRIDSAVTPSLSPAIDPPPPRFPPPHAALPRTRPKERWGIGAQASLFSVLQRKNGNVSIGRHTSGFKIVPALLPTRRGRVHFSGRGGCSVPFHALTDGIPFPSRSTRQDQLLACQQGRESPVPPFPPGHL